MEVKGSDVQVGRAGAISLTCAIFLLMSSDAELITCKMLDIPYGMESRSRPLLNSLSILSQFF